MRTILVSKREQALISDDDYAVVSAFNWFLTGNGYAMRWLPRNGSKRRRSVMMHRFIMNASHGQEIDHINGNRLDNRRENLRFVDRSTNQQRAVTKRGQSGFRGVRKIKGRWFARIHHQCREIPLGGFDSADKAAKAYNEAALVLYGALAAGNSV